METKSSQADPALSQNYPAAIIAMLWAVLFNWYDGLVARAISGKSKSHKLLILEQIAKLARINSSCVPLCK